MPTVKGILATVDSGETVGSIPFFAHDGRTNKLVAEIRVVVDGAVVPGAGIIPTRFEFYTTNLAGNLVASTGRSKFLSAPIVTSIATMGLATSASANSLWIAEVFIDRTVLLTGIGILNGATVAGNSIVGLYDTSGNLIASSASTANSGTNAFQEFSFTSTITVKGPARYFISVIANNGNHIIRTISPTDPGVLTNVVLQGGFALPSTITVPASASNGAGPIGYAF
jgi:hypothetical protein